jgi:hypothetical protein
VSDAIIDVPLAYLDGGEGNKNIFKDIPFFVAKSEQVGLY